jgi:HD superfamily phosphodiesterase
MMDPRLRKTMKAMIAYDAGCPKRIQHFLKVHSFARLIAETEGLDEETVFILEAAALVHDIGIRPALEKYDSSAGYLQEKEGPSEAKKLLEEAGGFSEEQIERIMYLVGHHHTYTGIDGLDYRILVEADFLVNLYESESRYRAILAAEDRVFETETGKWILHEQFGINS